MVALAGLGDVADAGPGVVIGHDRDLVGGEPFEQLHPRLGGLRRVAVVGELHPRLFQQQDRVVAEVAKEAEGFPVRRHHEDGVAHGVAGRRDRLHAGQEFLAVLVEHDAVAHRQQVLAGVNDEVLQRAICLAFIGPEIEIGLGDVVLRVGEQHLAAVVHHAADVVDMGMGEHDGVDVLRLDAGFLHALLLTSGARAEILRRAHAGVEQDQLVAGVDDRRVLLEHDVFRREEIVGQHLLHLVVRHADESALGRTERQLAVGDDGDLGVAETEAVEIGRLRADLGRFRQRRFAKHGRCAEARAESKQRPSRYIWCHGASSTLASFLSLDLPKGERKTDRIPGQLQAALALSGSPHGGVARR